MVLMKGVLRASAEGVSRAGGWGCRVAVGGAAKPRPSHCPSLTLRNTPDPNRGASYRPPAGPPPPLTAQGLKIEGPGAQCQCVGKPGIRIKCGCWFMACDRAAPTLRWGTVQSTGFPPERTVYFLTGTVVHA